MAITLAGTTGITFPDATIQNSASFDGATVTTSAVDITLSNSSGQTQVVSMTAANKSVILPDATTFNTQGGPIYIIQNKGQNPFYIKNNAGTIITPPLSYGQSVQLVLVSNATAAGTWSTSGTQSNSTVASFGPINASTITPNINRYVVVAGLSSTQALIAYNNVANTSIQVVLATISGSTVTYGTPTTLLTVTNGYVWNGVGLSSTLGAFIVSNATDQPQIVAVSVSGSTLTVGTAVTCQAAALSIRSSGGASPPVIFASTSTTGAVAFTVEAATTLSRVQGFSISGTTVTVGTAQTLVDGTAGGVTQYCSTVQLSAGSYVSIYQSSGSAVCAARTWTLSGTTITLGTQTAYAATTQQYTILSAAAIPGGGYAASSTCAVFTYSGNSATVNTLSTTISSVIAQSSYLSGAGATSGIASQFGTAGAIVTNSNDGFTTITTGSSNGAGGTAVIGYAGLQQSYGCGYLDSTTNLIAGVYNNFVSAIVVKAN